MKQGEKFGIRRKAWFCTLVFAFTIEFACSNVETSNYVPFEYEIGQNGMVSVTGEVCGPSPGKIDSPGILGFTIDNSFSNEDPDGTDDLQNPCNIPNDFGYAVCNYRYHAVRSLIQRFWDESEQRFSPSKMAMMHFLNSSVKACGKNPDTGTVDWLESNPSEPLENAGHLQLMTLGESLECIDPHEEGNDWTETGHASLAVKDFIASVAGSMEPLKAQQTSVDWFFVTDGVPFDGYNGTSYWEYIYNIGAVWDELHNKYADNFRYLRTHMIAYGMDIWPPEDLDTINELGDWITAGGTRGIFTTVDDISTIDLFDLITKEFSKKNHNGAFFVINNSVVVHDSLEPDSDGDGLSDEEEAALYGTDYLLWDTDGDGVSDLHEHLTGTNPLIPDGGSCNHSLDSDHDGLSDCTENRFNTSVFLPDTDSDGIPDGIEIRFGTNPLVHDANQDPDNDGVDNITEIMRGLDPNIKNTEKMEALAQKYSISSYTEEDGSVCRKFKVSNIPLGITLPNGFGEKGVNYIDIMNDNYIFDDPLSHLWLTSSVTAQFDGDVRIPATGIIEVKNSDFQ